MAKATLLSVQQTIPFELDEIDITRDRNLFEKYKEQIPVVFINGRKAFKFRVDDGKLRKKLKRMV
ncbi:MAG: glutaredoxin family protein [bacterium]